HSTRPGRQKNAKRPFSFELSATWCTHTRSAAARARACALRLAKFARSSTARRCRRASLRTCLPVPPPARLALRPRRPPPPPYARCAHATRQAWSRSANAAPTCKGGLARRCAGQSQERTASPKRRMAEEGLPASARAADPKAPALLDAVGLRKG